MHDSSAKRSKHHCSANHDSTNHNHRSAAITINKYTAHRSCTEKRNNSQHCRYMFWLNKEQCVKNWLCICPQCLYLIWNVFFFLTLFIGHAVWKYVIILIITLPNSWKYTQPLTSRIHRGKHDWGQPGNLTVGNWKVLLNLLKVDGEGLGKGIGESYGDESAKDNSPAPSSIWWLVDGIGCCCRGHIRITGWVVGTDKKQWTEYK